MAKVNTGTPTVYDTHLANDAEEDAPKAEPKRRGRPAPKPKPLGDYSGHRSFNQFDDFTAWLGSYPDTAGLSLYVYRIEPVINLALIDSRNTSIDLIVDPAKMTREYIQKEHGGGRYKLILSDSNQKRGSQQAATSYLEIDSTLCPPILNPLTLVIDDPRKNQGYIQSQITAGVLVRDESGRVKVKTENSTAPPAAAAAPPPVAPVPGQVGQVGQDDLQKQLVKILLERAFPPVSAAAPPLDSNRTIEQALSLADRLHPQNPISEKLITGLLERALAPPAAPVAPPAAAPDMFDAYEKVEAMLERLGAGRSSANTGFNLGSFIADLTKALPIGFQIWQAFKQQPQAAPPPSPGWGSQPPRPQPVQPASAGPQLQGDVDDVNMLMNPDFQARMLAVGERAIAAFTRGIPGMNFAVGLCAMEADGVEIYKLLENLGAPMIIQTLGSAPQCAGLLSDPVQKRRLEMWIDDFLSYDYDASGDAADEKPELGSQPA